jgi:CRP-like cAMP-binding protein
MSIKYPDLYNFAKLIAPIAESEWLPFEPSLQYMEQEKGTILSAPDEIPEYLYFVASGILRIYYQDANGREFTKFFCGPNQMIGAYAELLQGEKTRSYIQVVTDAKIFQFPFKKYREMLELYNSWKDFGRIVAEQNYVMKERREYMLLQLSSEECYQMFTQDFKEIISDLPQYQIASYLGMTPEGFNRFLKKRNATS